MKDGSEVRRACCGSCGVWGSPLTAVPGLTVPSFYYPTTKVLSRTPVAALTWSPILKE